MSLLYEEIDERPELKNSVTPYTIKRKNASERMLRNHIMDDAV